MPEVFEHPTGKRVASYPESSPHAPTSPTMTPPNRAETPNRKIGDHTTHLINLRPDMRPAGITVSHHERDAKGVVSPEATPYTYEANTPEKIHQIVEHGVNSLKGRNSSGVVKASVDYNLNDLAEARKAHAENAIKNDPRLDPSHPSYEHSGTARFMIESAHHANAEARIPQFEQHSVRVGF